jgi:hypothetical protein
MEVPNAIAAPEMLITDELGAPLTLNGDLVTMSPSSCAPPPCLVDARHPALAGHRWYQFDSQLLTSSAGDGSRQFTLKFRFDNPATCQVLEASTRAVWFTDDRDTRYGSIVQEGFAVIPPTVPFLSGSQLIGLALAFFGLGLFFIRRSQRARLPA